MTGSFASRRGSTLIETPIILVFFLLTFIEIVDVGQVMFFQTMLLDRARAAARYAAVNTYSSTAIANVVAYNDPAGSGTGLFGLQASMVTVNRYGAGTNSDRLEISISGYPLAFFGPLLASSFSSRAFRVVTPVQALGATR